MSQSAEVLVCSGGISFHSMYLARATRLRLMERCDFEPPQPPRCKVLGPQEGMQESYDQGERVWYPDAERHADSFNAFFSPLLDHRNIIL